MDSDMEEADKADVNVQEYDDSEMIENAQRWEADEELQFPEPTRVFPLTNVQLMRLNLTPYEVPTLMCSKCAQLCTETRILEHEHSCDTYDAMEEDEDNEAEEMSIEETDGKSEDEDNGAKKMPLEETHEQSETVQEKIEDIQSHDILPDLCSKCGEWFLGGTVEDHENLCLNGLCYKCGKFYNRAKIVDHERECVGACWVLERFYVCSTCGYGWGETVIDEHEKECRNEALEAIKVKALLSD
ncbi:unnamed protein product [Orchesella dallaii]|uniref:Uncharacterized protein n=1 Tax=Orchesella dallaii TaxID=48710 RepID=A0ABP1PMU6_9HEXA